MTFLDKVKGWLAQIVEVGLLLVALGIVVQVLIQFAGINQGAGRQRVGWPDCDRDHHVALLQEKPRLIRSFVKKAGSARNVWGRGSSRPQLFLTG